MINAAQCRAARGLIGWSQQELAKNAGVGTLRSIRRAEQVSLVGPRSTDPAGFETAGVEFIDENGGGAGVRLRKPSDKGLKIK